MRPQATRKVVIIKGKGTAKETRIETNLNAYKVERNGKVYWVTIPGRDDD